MTIPHRQLLMEANSRELVAVAFSPREAHSMVCSTIALSPDTPSPLRRLEDAVYDHDFLLAEYRRTVMLYDSPRVAALPYSPDERVVMDMFRTLYPASEPGTEALVSLLPELNMSLCSEIPSDVRHFICRTFPGVTLEHPLAPLCRYFRARHPQRRKGKTLVNIRGNRLDIITLGQEAPMLVTSHYIETAMDAVYYILASREALRLPDTDEILIAGDRMLRAEITPVLRRYVRYVMPAIFPSVMFRAGKASLSAPFELVVAPLVAAAANPVIHSSL